MGFGRGRNEGGTTTVPAAPTPQSSNAGGLTAFIDQGSAFEGKLSFKDTVRIDGHFSGEITSENTLIVGETGEVEANIRSKSVMISGAVVGDVTATRQLVLHKTGRLQGNVETPSIIMEEGAVFNGNVKMARPESMSKDTGKLKAVEGGSGASKSGDK